VTPLWQRCCGSITKTLVTISTSVCRQTSADCRVLLFLPVVVLVVVVVVVVAMVVLVGVVVVVEVVVVEVVVVEVVVVEVVVVEVVVVEVVVVVLLRVSGSYRGTARHMWAPPSLVTQCSCQRRCHRESLPPHGLRLLPSHRQPTLSMLVVATTRMP
jgi:hypothetical protein